MMPVYPCKHGTCTAFVPRRGEYCAEHQEQGRRESAERNRFYDQHARDAQAKAFYHSAAWQRARKTRLAAHPVCERCQEQWSRHVHHTIPLKRCTPQQRTAQDNLMAVCVECHNKLEAQACG